MIKQFLQRWLGIQELSDMVVTLRHRDEMDKVDLMFADHETNIVLTEDLPQPGDVIEPEPQVVKGYEQ